MVLLGLRAFSENRKNYGNISLLNSKPKKIGKIYDSALTNATVKVQTKAYIFCFRRSENNLFKITFTMLNTMTKGFPNINKLTDKNISLCTKTFEISQKFAS